MHADVDASTGDWRGVSFGVGISAFAAYHQFKLPVVLPVLLETYGYERALAGSYVSVYAVAGLALSAWIGGVLERRGAAVPVLLAAALLASGCALTLYAPASGAVVLAGRGLEGLGFAVLAVAGPTLANANAPPAHAAVVAGLSATWIPIGQLTATGLAPLALASVGWTLLWWLGIAGALVLAIAVPALHASRGIALAPARRGTAAPDRLRGGERNTLFVVACVFGLWSGQYFAYMTWLPQYLVEVHGLAVQGALAGYVVPVALVALLNVATGAMLRAGMPLGPLMTVAIATQGTVWWLLPHTGSDWTGVASLVAYGVGAGVVPTCLFAAPGAVVGPGRSTARALGVLMTGRNLGVLVGPVLLAWVAGDGAHWAEGSRLFAMLSTLAMALSAVFWMRLRRGRHAMTVRP
jgi:MFS family permease